MSDADGRRVMATLAELPAAVGPLMIQYLGLFRPTSGGLRYSRMLSLLDELKPLILEGQVVRNGRTWPAPVGFWVEVLQHLASRPASLRLPLKTNGYLLEVLGTMGEQLAAKHERAREAELQRGHRPNDPPAGRTGMPSSMKDILSTMRESIS